MDHPTCMVDISPFPPYPKPTLSRQDIVGYLVPYRNKGWEIYQGDNENEFIIRVSETDRVYIWFAPPFRANNEKACWVVSSGIRREGAIWGYPENLQSLQVMTSQAVKVGCHGSKPADWSPSTAPTSTRLWREQPATNISKLVGLIGTSSIEAIYDAYLDNKSLEILLSMIALGVRISNSVRLLTSTAMIIPLKGTPRVTKNFVDAWFKEVGPKGEMRHNAYRGHERRFMLLSGDKSLLSGLSINNPDVNEAPVVESDSVDRTYFDSEWSRATSL